MLNTTVALDHCGNLQSVLFQVDNFYVIEPRDRDNLSRAVSHIHTCLTKRVEYVQRSCKDLGPDAIPTFDNTPFDIPKVVNVLNDLAKSSKANIPFFFCGISVVLIVNFLVGKTGRKCAQTAVCPRLLICMCLFLGSKFC